MKLKIYFIPLLVLIISLSGCESLKMQVQENPVALSSSQLTISGLSVSVQVNTAAFFHNIQNFSGQTVRMYHMGGGATYQAAYTPQNFDATWTNAYANILTDADNLISKSEQAKFFDQAAAGQILKAYTLTTLVDFFGDVPYTPDYSVGIPSANPSPTSGATIYAEAVKILDLAIANLGKTSTSLTTPDLYFGGTISANRTRWLNLANSLKFRIFVQTRKVDANAGAKAQAVLTDGRFLTGTNHFSFKYSSTNANPDSRHPFFTANYILAPTLYIPHYLMFIMSSTNDPRIRYYFYRQSFAAATVATQPCSSQAKPTWYAPTDPFCRLDFAPGSGWWGRDHGDNDGIPPDGTLRTTSGIYPAGGRFDAGAGGAVTQTQGLLGAGIGPVFMVFYMDFLRAEAALTMGTGDNARTMLENGIRNSITAVITFGRTQSGYDATQEPTNVAIDAYVNAVLANYDATATNEAKLQIVINEYFRAAYGNGLEAYNAYRRTGYPNNLQPTVKVASPGAFIRSFFYPAVSTNSNPNMVQKSGVDVRVFWDNGSTVLK